MRAITGIAEIDIAVPRNKANTARSTPAPIRREGTIHPSPAPMMNGRKKPPTQLHATTRPALRKSPKRISEPESITKNSTPIHPMISSRSRWFAPPGNTARKAPGQAAPRTEADPDRELPDDFRHAKTQGHLAAGAGRHHDEGDLDEEQEELTIGHLRSFRASLRLTSGGVRNRDRRRQERLQDVLVGPLDRLDQGPHPVEDFNRAAVVDVSLEELLHLALVLRIPT